MQLLPDTRCLSDGLLRLLQHGLLQQAGVAKSVHAEAKATSACTSCVKVCQLEALLQPAVLAACHLLLLQVLP